MSAQAGRTALTRSVCVALALLLVAACADSPTTSATRNACASSVTGGARSVTCPGVTGCACAAPQICCLGAIDSRAGTCQDPRACGGLELTCDGPEDCSGGVCCLTATGSTCTAASACSGAWLCRGDAHCAGSPGGSNCVPADFGTPGVADRGLDGLIGICRQ